MKGDFLLSTTLRRRKKEYIECKGTNYSYYNKQDCDERWLSWNKKIVVEDGCYRAFATHDASILSGCHGPE